VLLAGVELSDEELAEVEGGLLQFIVAGAAIGGVSEAVRQIARTGRIRDYNAFWGSVIGGAIGGVALGPTTTVRVIAGAAVGGAAGAGVVERLMNR